MNSNKDLSIDETFAKAIEYHKVKKINLAKKFYKEVINKDPHHIHALNNLGIILFSLKKFNDAIKIFQKTISVNSNNYSSYNNLGMIYTEIQNFQKAINSFEEAVKINPNYFEAQYNIGLVHYKCRDYRKAISSYLRAIKLNPNFFEAYNSMGLAYSKFGEYQKAILSYENAIKINPNYLKAHNNMGTTFYEFGEYQKAISSYKKAIEINPNIMETYCNIGLAYEKTNEISKAINNYLKIPKSDSNFVRAQYSYALLLLGIKEYKKAAKIFKSIDYKKSKSYLLKSLFELDDKSNFFIELDGEIKKNKCDAVIASTITSAEIKYGIKKKNLFCEFPLDYTINKNLTKQYDFNNIFVKTSHEILNNDAFNVRPQSLLTNGIQTAGNIFDYKDKNIKRIEYIIHKEIENYRLSFNKSEEGFIKNWPKNYELVGWLVKMKDGGKIDPHIHDHGWLSGSIYINVPPKLKNNSGNLVVSLNSDQNKKNDNYDGKNNKVIDVVTGSFCLFPASLFHYTIPFKSREERIVLAFDVTPSDLSG